MVFTELFSHFCRRCLHREDYKFDDEVEANLEENVSFKRSKHSPSQHILFGFKDRNLEDEYLEDLARVGKSRILLGYCVSVLLIIAVPFLDALQAIPIIHSISELDQETLAELPEFGYRSGPSYEVTQILPTMLCLAFFVAGFVAVCLIYRLAAVSKRRIFAVTGVVFLLYIAVAGYAFSKSWNLWDFVYGDNSWPIYLINSAMPPLLSLFFMGVPSALNTEILLLACLTFLVIVPLVCEMWGLENTENWRRAISARPEDAAIWLNQVCTGEMEATCVRDFELKQVYPYLVLCIVGLAAVIVGFIADHSNRSAFVNKKVIAEQKVKLILNHKLREETLVKEHKKKEDTIIEMFENF
ncbi:hypothetical protein A3770_11p61790 [Chloropicon primus]|uniref:Uncharacterized protein n=1 Tax=Chloropicon primus TaxID=1764295 RepID=A0A5B8MTE1_9CHLO|nr:hypothetical protein A3770_11p61790 [Chloropicon primus]|mmetsp:Transcript_13927/g.39305  ORF Transcript_13927/g.39305 Transcript_13927/m.39305 type:complete len:356 (-) Transcript_13927:60-1127(-)|eukprot:QDZ23661.1 hypothetical protein A3770_11p61790 [Chloropicon primus]